jgi:hypothetical protein
LFGWRLKPTGGTAVKKTLVMLGVSACLITGARAELMVDVGNSFTMGKFDYEDATIEVKSSIANPRAGLEYRFAESPFGLGIEYAMSENDFEGEYENSDGDLTMERTEYVAYLRLGSRDSVNVRFGYRSFEYDISDGDIRQSNGEHDINGVANGDMTTGIDAELNLVFGEETTFGVGIGYTFFMDAEYTWEYDIESTGAHRTGSATLDAHSLRIRPELSFKLNDNTRLYFNAVLAATAWEGTPEGEQEYPGYDVFSAAGVGIRYYFR